jgi:tRNA (guanine-N7-)-methyltransferase
MTVGKQQRFQENEQFDHVLEHTDYESSDDTPAGKWNQQVFEKEQPIVLELACGKGEYSNALAKKYPDKNFVGVDIKGSRIWKGAKQALREDIPNVRFLRIYIDHLTEYFAQNEVSDIWITFPDPFRKRRDRKKRLTSPKFLRLYQQVLQPGGFVRLKTDSDLLFNYTRRITKLHNCPVEELVENVYETHADDELLTIQTFFEGKHLEEGRTIKYIRFRLPEEPINDLR